MKAEITIEKLNEYIASLCTKEEDAAGWVLITSVDTREYMVLVFV